jgi:hypothetical protein
MACEWRTAELLDRLQNGTHKGKGCTADQSLHGSMGLGSACKETLRMKDVSIKSSGGKNYVLGLRKTVDSQKNSYIYKNVNKINVK